MFGCEVGLANFHPDHRTQGINPADYYRLGIIQAVNPILSTVIDLQRSMSNVGGGGGDGGGGGGFGILRRGGGGGSGPEFFEGRGLGSRNSSSKKKGGGGVKPPTPPPPGSATGLVTKGGR